MAEKDKVSEPQDPGAEPAAKEVSVPEGTTETGKDDASQDTPEAKRIAELEQKIEEQKQLRETDVARAKSALQRQINEKQREWEAKEAEYKKAQQDAAKKGMTQEQKEKYEHDLALERIQELEKQSAELKTQLAERDQMQRYWDYFTRTYGIEASKLDTTSADALYQSGMRAIEEGWKALQSGGTQKPTPTPKPVDAPQVVTSQGGSPAKMTIGQLAKKYNTDIEGIYRMVEQRQLPADIIPE